MELLENTCMICGCGLSRLWATRGGYSAYRCLECGFVYTWPIPSKDEIERIYGSEYFEGYDPEKATADDLYLKRLLQYRMDVEHITRFVSSGRVLDFGCGNGKYLEAMPGGFIKLGYEFNPKALDYLRSTGIGKFYSGDPADMPDRELDLITMRGVIEHLPDPLGTAALLSKRLKAGGYLFISATPNVDSPCATLYKERWNQFYPPEHLNYFSVRTLSILWARFGLVCIDAAYPYLGTPYEELGRDSMQWLEDAGSYFRSRGVSNEKSPPFVGNMLSAVFLKKA